MSMIRVVVESDSADYQLALSRADGSSVSLPDAGEPTLHKSLAAGQYTLTLTPSLSFDAKFCPLMTLELSIEPLNLTRINWPVCPSNRVDVLPQLVLSQLPVYFGTNSTTPDPVTFLTFGAIHPTDVAQWTFTVDNTAVMDAGLSSNFLRADLRLQLLSVQDDGSSTAYAEGQHLYNFNQLDVTLAPGTYILKIVHPPVVALWASPCVPFNLYVALQYVGDSSSASAGCTGQFVPYSLNGMRYLGLDGRTHVQASDWLIPHTSFVSTRNMQFTAPANVSLLRVYTEPHVVDIDIKLVLNATGEVLTSGSNDVYTEEELIYVLQPGVAYYVQLQFWAWQGVPVCSSFNMEFAISPAVALPSVCPDGGDMWPPAPPSTLPGDDGYSYSSLDRGDRLYYQQTSIGQLRSKSYMLQLSEPSDLHAQVGYRFLTGDLVVKLVSNATKQVQYGENNFNRNMLDVVALPAGKYTLTIYEPHVNAASVIGCSDFTFELLVRRSSSVTSMTPPVYLSSSLDSISYLLYSGTVHLQGTYNMWDDTQFAHETVTFTLTQASFLRIDSALAADREMLTSDGLALPVVEVQTVPPTQPLAEVWGACALLLQAGQYTVTFKQPIWYWTTNGIAAPLGGSLVDVELAITPLAELSYAISQQGLSTTCTGSSIPAIVPSPTAGYYLYRDDTLQFPMSTAVSQVAVAVLPFTLDRPSIVYLQVGYPFALDDVKLRLNSSTGANGGLDMFGRSYRNLNELNLDLPAGQYTIELFQPALFPQAPQLAHCAVYSLAVSITDASADPNHVDCTAEDMVPFDVNSAGGGSAAFGGPMDGSGSLILYGDSFLIPSQSADAIGIAVGEVTLVSVLTTETASDSVALTISNGSAVVTPIEYLSQHGNNERLGLWQLDVSDPTLAPYSYTINLLYGGVTRTVCPVFQLQVVARPVSLLVRDLECAASISPTLPLTTMTLDGRGFGSQFVDSYFPASFIAASGNGTGQFVYSVAVTLNTTSHVTAAISYHSLANAFVLSLAQTTIVRGVPTTSVVLTGNLQPQLTRSGVTTITQQLSMKVRAGNYTLVISQDRSVATALPSDTELCLPFIWDVQVIPDGTTDAYVSSVQPTAAVDLAPDQDLYLLVQFNSKLYTSTNQTVPQAPNSTVLVAAVYLSGSDGTSVSPSYAQGLTSDAKTWSFVFAANSLAPALTYTLRVQPKTLFDAAGHELFLGSTNVYTTLDTTCGGNGVYQGGQCLCATGYAGAACDRCDVGFTDLDRTGHNAKCVSGSCEVDTCGCDPKQQGCVPLGQCHLDSNTGYAVCSCSAGYAGDYCGQCAVGYAGYPYCVPHRDCPAACLHGTCNHNTGLCECTSNFAGSTCSSCATGWTGDDCAEPTTDVTGWSSTLAYVEITAVILIIAIVAGLLVWFIRKRYYGRPTRYSRVPIFDNIQEDDDDEDEPAREMTFARYNDPESGVAQHEPAEGPIN